MIAEEVQEVVFFGCYTSGHMTWHAEALRSTLLLAMGWWIEGGPAVVACHSLAQNPAFPTHSAVLLEDWVWEARKAGLVEGHPGNCRAHVICQAFDSYSWNHYPCLLHSGLFPGCWGYVTSKIEHVLFHESWRQRADKWTSAKEIISVWGLKSLARCSREWGMRRYSLGQTLIQSHSSRVAPLRLRPEPLGGLWNREEGVFSLGSSSVCMGREPIAHLS